MIVPINSPALDEIEVDTLVELFAKAKKADDTSEMDRIRAQLAAGRVSIEYKRGALIWRRM